jgi:hypothetical protein
MKSIRARLFSYELIDEQTLTQRGIKLGIIHAAEGHLSVSSNRVFLSMPAEGAFIHKLK